MYIVVAYCHLSAIMIHAEDVSWFLEQEGIEFIHCPVDDMDRWMVCHNLGTIIVESLCDGEILRVRSGPILDLSGRNQRDRDIWVMRLLAANDELLIGRFCVTDHVAFEIGIPFPGDARLTAEQLLMCIRTVTAVCFAAVSWEASSLRGGFEQ